MGFLPKKRKPTSQDKGQAGHWTKYSVAARAGVAVAIVGGTVIGLNIYNNNFNNEMNGVKQQIQNLNNNPAKNNPAPASNIPKAPTPITGIRAFDGTYSVIGTVESPLGKTQIQGTLTVVNGVVTDPDHFFTGTMDSTGRFTGQWTYSEGSLPIPMSGNFSTYLPTTLTGSISTTVRGTMVINKMN